MDSSVNSVKKRSFYRRSARFPSVLQLTRILANIMKKVDSRRGLVRRRVHDNTSDPPSFPKSYFSVLT